RRFHVGHPLHRRVPGRLRCDQGRRHSVGPRRRGAIRAERHPREHDHPRPVAHADGGSAARQAARRWRCRGIAQAAARAHPDGLCRRWPRHRQCRRVSRLRRGALRYRHRAGCRWRHERALRLRLSSSAYRRHYETRPKTAPGHAMTRLIIFPAAMALLVSSPAHAAPALDGAAMGWPWALPFAGILLSIATGPLLLPKFWHAHYGKIAAAWALLTLIPIAFIS